MAEAINEKIDREAEIARVETEKLAKRGLGLTIRKDEDLVEATDMLSQIKTATKSIKAKKDAIIVPANAAIKAVRDLFRPAEDSLKQAESSIKDSMLKYQMRVEARAAKKADTIEKAVDDGDISLAEGMTKLGSIKQAPTNVKAAAGSVSFREGPRKIRITDPALLPGRYLVHPKVVEALRLAVSEDVLKNNEPCPPGAEVYREKQVAGRTNT